MLRVTARCKKGESPEELINAVINEIRERLGDAVYSIENKELEEVVANLLISNNLTISIAES